LHPQQNILHGECEQHERALDLAQQSALTEITAEEVATASKRKVTVESPDFIS